MNRTGYLLSSGRAVMFLLWTPALAAAAVASLDQTLPSIVIDWVLVAISCVLATLAGATALFIRINNLLMADPSKPLVRPWLFAAAHMLGSWSAGVAGFLVSRAQHMDVWTSLLAVLLLAFLGAKGLELMAEKYLPVNRLLKEV